MRKRDEEFDITSGGNHNLPEAHIEEIYEQVIKTFSIREGWWNIGIKGYGGVKSKGTRFLIEKEKGNRPILTSKEKHSLTRKLVGYRNWRQRWCKKEGNKVLRKG